MKFNIKFVSRDGLTMLAVWHYEPPFFIKRLMLNSRASYRFDECSESEPYTTRTYELVGKNKEGVYVYEEK